MLHLNSIWKIIIDERRDEELVIGMTIDELVGKIAGSLYMIYSILWLGNMLFSEIDNFQN